MTRLFIPLFFLTFLSLSVQGQGQGGNISFRFVDPTCSDKPIVRVKIKLEGPKYKKTFHTNHDGTLNVSGLKAGRYELLASRYGFKRLVFKFDVENGATSLHRTFSAERGLYSDDDTPFRPGYEPCEHQERRRKP